MTAFWRRRLTVALAEQAREGLGTVASKNMRGTGSFVTALPKGARLRGLGHVRVLLRASHNCLRRLLLGKVSETRSRLVSVYATSMARLSFRWHAYLRMPCPLPLRLGNAICCHSGPSSLQLCRTSRRRLSSRSSFLCAPARTPCVRILHAPCGSSGLTGIPASSHTDVAVC